VTVSEPNAEVPDKPATPIKATPVAVAVPTCPVLVTPVRATGIGSPKVN
jgi:hypothetical protein